MIKNILITLLCLCVSFNTYAKSSKKVKDDEVIQVTNVFTCYDLNKATLTNGDIIYCMKDKFVKKKSDYNRDLAVKQINECLLTGDKLALLNLLGNVYCLDNEESD